jgi:hypothetical protein
MGAATGGISVRTQSYAPSRKNIGDRGQRTTPTAAAFSYRSQPMDSGLLVALIIALLILLVDQLRR